MHRNITSASLILSLFGLVALPTPAQAQAQTQGQWELYKFLDVGVIATDNLRLGELNEIGFSDEVVYSIRPSVELTFRGNRFNTGINAEIEAYHFGEQGFDIIDPRLSLNSEGLLVENLLFLDTSLDIAKVLPGDDFFDLNENREIQGRFKFNPYIARPIGRFADLYFGYGHQSLDTDLNGDVEFWQNTLAFSLRRDPRFGGFIWGVGANYETSSVAQSGPDQDFDNRDIFASLGHTLGRTTFFEVVVGREQNDVTESNLVEDSAAYFEARLHYTPTDRTTMVAGFSDRFFGEGPTFSLEHRVRNSTLSAEWTRDINNNDISLGSVTPFSGVTDSTVPTTSTGFSDNDATGSRLFVNEQFRVGYKLAGLRSDLILDGIYSDQEEIDGEADSFEFIGRVALDRHLSPLTTVRLQYEHWIDDDPIGVDGIEGDRDNENRVGVRLIYNFDRKERQSIINE